MTGEIYTSESPNKPRFFYLLGTMETDTLNDFYGGINKFKNLGLYFESEYYGKFQGNIGVRKYFEDEIPDLFQYNKLYFPLIREVMNDFTYGILLPSFFDIFNIINPDCSFSKEREIVFLNYPVFHFLTDPILEGGAHRDLFPHTKEDIIENMDSTILFTVVVFLKKSPTDGNLIFPELPPNKREIVANSGDYIIFDSALLHDIKPFAKERVSLVMQFYFDGKNLIHFI